MSPEEKKCIEKLERAQARREKLYANMYVCYGYTKDGVLLPNMIPLPHATREAHKAFLENQVASLLSDKSFDFTGLRLVKRGYLNNEKNTFESCSLVVVVDFNELKSRLESVNV